MADNVLVATHLSPLYPPTQASSLVVLTKQSNAPLPLPAADADLPSEHATYSQIFDSPETGTILMRLLHGGLILELIALTHEVTPLRIVFPFIVLPCPSLLVWESRELHVIAFTNFGSLFRVVLPLQGGAILWHNTSIPGRKWWREYVVTKVHGNLSRSLVQVQGSYCVAVSLPDGSLLRLEARPLGNDSEDDQWDENIFHHTSLFNSLASFLHAGIPGASDIISLATLPQPTDIAYVWSLSRDRTLRLWTGIGCVAAKTLPSTSSGGQALTSPTSSKVPTLLQADPQRLLRAFVSQDSEVPYVIVFIPSESALNAGAFYVISTAHDYFQIAEVIDCSANSAHCHLQDFIVKDEVLYTLWDRQGQSVVQWVNVLANPAKTDGETEWRTATYPPEVELTPAYLDELLLSPGSLTDRYFEAIMRPGMFSDLTLKRALSQYTDACLSLHGEQPPQLNPLRTYTSLGENIAAVVGCTVQLTKDPRSGAPQYDQYWSALKRDWEGFIARCREIERSVRWPLSIGVAESHSGVLIVERERLASVVDPDTPLQLHRNFSLSVPVDPQYALLEILWMLRTKVGRRTMANLESKLVGISQQEVAFVYADIIQDTASSLSFKNDLDEGLDSWITGRLASVGNIQAATREVLDVIGGLIGVVKTEDEDAPDALLPSPNLEWRRALAASYATSSIHARYDLCITLVTLLFFLSEEVDQWDASLLEEIFVVFRGVAILRYASRQPVSTNSQGTGTEEEVIAGLRNMNVSSASPQYAPTISLIHRLIDQVDLRSSIPTAAHHFLDTTGVLSSLSATTATKDEVAFCERLRLLGYHEATRDSLAWFPRTPAVCYVSARLWIDEGRYDDAASFMETLAGVFGLNSGLSRDDREALEAVLPGGFYDSAFHFYLHAASLFKAAGVTSYEVTFSQLALSVAPSGLNTSSLWYNVIRGLIDLGLYQDSYATLLACPYDKFQLVYRMCEENAVDRLMSFNFAGLTTEVEEALSFKVRNADPRIRPFYSRILYTWHVSRGDFRNAAAVMYQRARKLGTLYDNPADFDALAELQLEAYVVSINALSLIDPASAWFVMPLTNGHDREPRKRKKLSVHVPESKYAFGKKDAEIVQLADIQYEHALLDAQMELNGRDPHFISAGGLSLSPSALVLKLAQLNRFNTAMATARNLDVDMSDVFAHLTNQCIRLERYLDDVMSEDTSDWLLTDKASSWPGTYADRGWRYLRNSLEKHDGPHTDFSYSKVVFETLLAFDRSSTPPPWLVQSLERHHPEFLIRAFLRYDLLEFALEQVLSLMHKSDARLATEQPRGNFVTWLPYTLIDQVLLAADSQDDLSSRARSFVQELRAEIASRLKRVQKFGQATQ
ncbi:unnamed protein product [Somion occarium]|uniref:Nuclear pore complex protein Nup160 n=1 Tax=Somion occarium TaxID=3059160 RepID=A0ABP1D2G1_9APHY